MTNDVFNKSSQVQASANIDMVNELNKPNSLNKQKLKFHIFPDERFVDLKLYQFGWENCESLHSFGPYKRNHFLFHYVIKGKGTLKISISPYEDYSFNIAAGEGFLIYPEIITSYYADMDDPWEYCWVEFDGLIVNETLQLAGFSARTPVYQAKSPEYSAKLHKAMMQIIDNYQASTLQLTGYAYLFLDILCQSSINQKERGDKTLQDYYINEAVNYISRHYSENISVADIATACGINQSYFSKLFKEMMGTSPHNFLITYRMNKAEKLLLDTNYLMKEISEQVGYSNQLAFSKAFRNYHGSSPSEWRKAHKIHGENS